jgi:hypothetical protein
VQITFHQSLLGLLVSAQRIVALQIVALQRIATVAQQMRQQRALAGQFLRTSYSS